MTDLEALDQSLIVLDIVRRALTEKRAELLKAENDTLRQQNYCDELARWEWEGGALLPD